MSFPATLNDDNWNHDLLAPPAFASHVFVPVAPCRGLAPQWLSHRPR